jgi:flavin-dependent dehydrogenase
MRFRYDAVVVGARGAGASLATLLARNGASVRLLDKDRLPSDQVLSTQIFHPPGMDVLDDLGVGDQVRAGAPASRIVRLAKNDATLDIEYADGRAEYCPRRERLDGLLQNAAANAGAELVDRARVTALIEEDGPGGRRSRHRVLSASLHELT